MKLPVVVLGFMVLGWMAGCSPTGEGATAATRATTRPAAREVREIVVGGAKRSYILRTPAVYDGKKKVPLVMLLHGANDSAAYAEEAYGFAEKQEKEGFVLVLPDAVGERHAWHGYDPEPNADLAFLRTVLANVTGELAIDPARVYAAGHSSGAIMTYRLAAEMGDKIAAIGIVAGSVGAYDKVKGTADIPKPKGNVSVAAFHGMEDDNIDFVTGSQAVRFWTASAGCKRVGADEVVAGEVKRARFANEGTGVEVAFYQVVHGNHMWPGAKEMPGKTLKPSRAIDATGVMWEFFKAHPKK